MITSTATATTIAKIMPLRIMSWNINGLRSLKTDLKEFLTSLNADIICLQETKVTRKFSDAPNIHVFL